MTANVLVTGNHRYPAKTCLHCGLDPVPVPFPPESLAAGKKELCPRYVAEGGLRIDGCLGDKLLPGVVQCCCGHGDKALAYVVFSDSLAPGEHLLDNKKRKTETFRGKKALRMLQFLAKEAQ